MMLPEDAWRVDARAHRFGSVSQASVPPMQYSGQSHVSSASASLHTRRSLDGGKRYCPSKPEMGEQ